MQIKPVVILCVISAVVTAALALTYQITKPIIDEINLKNANEARAEVMPEAESFTLVEVPLNDNVLEVHKADNGCGYVFTTVDKGFGGTITVMVGIDSAGGITGIKVTEHAETPGLGTKPMAADYLTQYLGQTAITRTEEAGQTQIDAITGATITSNAIYRAVETALLQFSALGGEVQ